MSQPPQQVAPRYYDLLLAGFVAALICSNFIGPGKVAALDLPLIGAVAFGAGNIFFPITYIFGDILTEVYGFARARRAIWAGFGAMLFATLMANIVIWLPASKDEPYNAILQPALETVFGASTRIVAASILAYWVGDFVNSYVLAKLKVRTAGRFLWMRTIGSTVVGQGFDSLIFYPLAFGGTWQTDTLLVAMGVNWVFKVMVEVVMTPATYWVCAKLKRAEGIDHYDRGTSFTPFSLDT
jgi:uncharacterized integral membrane protein (TIGR00697 family)